MLLLFFLNVVTVDAYHSNCLMFFDRGMWRTFIVKGKSTY